MLQNSICPIAIATSSLAPSHPSNTSLLPPLPLLSHLQQTPMVAVMVRTKTLLPTLRPIPLYSANIKEWLKSSPDPHRPSTTSPLLPQTCHCCSLKEICKHLAGFQLQSQWWPGRRDREVWPCHHLCPPPPLSSIIEEKTIKEEGCWRLEKKGKNQRKRK